MDEITTLREMRPAPTAAELDAMRVAARQRFLAETGSRAAHRKWRMPALAGGLTAAAAASTAAALVLTNGPATVPGQHATRQTQTVVTTAWTVREDADGTVTVYLRQYANPAGLQQALQADGINAFVRPVPVRTVPVTIPAGPQGAGKPRPQITRPACSYAATNDAPQAVQQAVVTIAVRDLPARFIIRPDAMPQGSALLLPFVTGMPASPKNGNTGAFALIPVVLNNDTLPACVPISKGAPNFAVKAKQG